MTILGELQIYPVVEKAQMMPHSTDTWKWFQYSPCDGAYEIIKRNPFRFLLEVYIEGLFREYVVEDIFERTS